MHSNPRPQTFIMGETLQMDDILTQVKVTKRTNYSNDRRGIGAAIVNKRITLS